MNEFILVVMLLIKSDDPIPIPYKVVPFQSTSQRECESMRKIAEGFGFSAVCRPANRWKI